MTRHRMMLFALTFLLCFSTQAASAGDYPDTWYFDRPDEHTALEGTAAPELTVGKWVGAEFKKEDMKGNIVVIDFWATWCGPCIAAMPKNTKIAEKYADQGVKFIGVCLSGDESQMAGIVKKNGAKYPNAYVDGDQVSKDWPVTWYPTYAVVDRKGVVRAIGLTPDSVEKVIESLLLDEAAAKGIVRVNPAWLEGDTQKRARLSELEKNSDNPPPLAVKGWQNSKPIKIADQKGKVVVLDFWGTFSPSCIKRIEYHNELLDKYSSQGLVFIGVAATLGGEKVGDIVHEHGIRYPVCVDVENKTNISYGPNGFPDYYLIDKSGKLRIADCTNASLEDAIAALLSEKIQEEEGKDDKASAKKDQKPAAE